MEAGKYALLASYQAEWCARAVHEYIDATTRGASRAVKILEVAVVLGKISEAILSLIAVGQGLIRLLSRKGATAALEGGAQRQLTGGQRQLPAGKPTGGAPVPRGAQTVEYSSNSQVSAPVRKVVVKDRGNLGEAVDEMRRRAGLSPRPGGTFYDKLGANESIQLAKARKEYMEWLVKNPNASTAEKFAKHDRDIIARFGHLD